MLDHKLYKILIEVLDKKHFTQYPEDFSKRIIVQKTLYILTHGKDNRKLSLPYKWSFYLRGPYSSEIAHMIYYMNDYLPSLEENKSRIQLDEEEIKAISHFQDFRKALLSIDEEINEEDLFEIAATILYISEQIGNDINKITDKFEDFKPNLKQKISSDNFNKILDLMSQFNYI